MKRDINKLRKWCIRRKLDGWPVTKICSHARIPRRTFYFWWNKYQEGGFENLEPKSRAPKTVHKTPQEVVDRIIKIRKAENLNEKAIVARLKSEGVEVSHGTVYKYLAEHGLINHLDKPRKQKQYRHWSRKHPNSLWQTDLCLFENRWLSTFLDDCSRFVVGIAFFNQGTTEKILGLLESTISEHGKPREVLTDHGTQYYATKGQVSAFTQFCESKDIKHIFGGIGKPTTLGKIERFHRTFREVYPRFKNLEKFTQYYNSKPHRGLNYATPEKIYLG